MKKKYWIEKRTTRGWALIAQRNWKFGAWLFVRKYLKKHKGVSLRYFKSEYK